MFRKQLVNGCKLKNFNKFDKIYHIKIIKINSIIYKCINNINNNNINNNNNKIMILIINKRIQLNLIPHPLRKKFKFYNKIYKMIIKIIIKIILKD